MVEELICQIIYYSQFSEKTFDNAVAEQTQLKREVRAKWFSITFESTQFKRKARVNRFMNYLHKHDYGSKRARMLLS